MIWILIFIGLALVAGFAGGWFAGSYFSRQLNTTLRHQLMLTQQYADKWAADAAQQYTLSERISTSANTNLTTTLLTLEQLLRAAAAHGSEDGFADRERRMKIEALIAETKRILPSEPDMNERYD